MAKNDAIKWLAKRRFNYVDATSVGVLVGIWREPWWVLLLIWIGFVILSVEIERRADSKNCGDLVQGGRTNSGKN